MKKNQVLFLLETLLSSLQNCLVDYYHPVKKETTSTGIHNYSSTDFWFASKVSLQKPG